jgi:hypothetical protein
MPEGLYGHTRNAEPAVSLRSPLASRKALRAYKKSEASRRETLRQRQRQKSPSLRIFAMGELSEPSSIGVGI